MINGIWAELRGILRGFLQSHWLIQVAIVLAGISSLGTAIVSHRYINGVSIPEKVAAGLVYLAVGVTFQAIFMAVLIPTPVARYADPEFNGIRGLTFGTSKMHFYAIASSISTTGWLVLMLVASQLNPILAALFISASKMLVAFLIDVIRAKLSFASRKEAAKTMVFVVGLILAGGALMGFRGSSEQEMQNTTVTILLLIFSGVFGAGQEHLDDKGTRLASATVYSSWRMLWLAIVGVAIVLGIVYIGNLVDGTFWQTFLTVLRTKVPVVEAIFFVSIVQAVGYFINVLTNRAKKLNIPVSEIVLRISANLALVTVGSIAVASIWPDLVNTKDFTVVNFVFQVVGILLLIRAANIIGDVKKAS